MPIIYERHQSRVFTVDSKTASLTREYVVTGTTDETETYELAIISTPRIYDNLVRKSVRAEPQGGGIWYVMVEYATIDTQEAVGETPENPEGPDAGGDGPVQLGPNISWDTTGGNVHITQSRESRLNPATGVPGWRVGGAAAPNNKQAIGVTTDEVKGCDIITPAFNWQIDVKRASCTFAYMTRVWELTGKVNYAKKFYGFPPGAVLYLGASARHTYGEQWEITHKFSCQRNEVNLAIGNGIIVTTKLGWDYMWVGYKAKADANQLLQVPEVAYVERVYESGNFDLLEIGN